MELIDRKHLLVDVASLKQSPWFNRGKNEQYLHGVYLERKEAIETVEDLCIKSEPTVEAISKADYETRLKADMVAMLTDIQLEIEERQESILGRYDNTILERDKPMMKLARNEGRKECKEIIQQKINALKGDSND